jgi:5-methyltetrahydropteroyltriglutamate--homocysteine methyltransferase
VGSLLRPPDLLQARDDFAGGRIPAHELKAIEDDPIRDVVRTQEDIGLRSAIDGEFRRASWQMDFIYALAGIENAEDDLVIHIRNPDGDIDFTPAPLNVSGKIDLHEPTMLTHDEQVAKLERIVETGQEVWG